MAIYDETKPFVSVRLMTYNHEPFIRKAMEGIMMQQTNFPVEVVVGDDFSNDRTLDVIREFKNTDKIFIKILEREHGDKYHQERLNLGRLFNFANIVSNCEGNYIALLDGDDYWSDPLKLQKQYDFLEENPDYVLAYHNAKIIDHTEKIISESKLSDFNKVDRDEQDLRKGQPVLTLTMFFRNVISEFPPEFYKVVNGDVFLISMLGSHGKGKYIKNIIDAKYRVHNDGLWTAKKNSSGRYKSHIRTFYHLYKYHKRLNNTNTAAYFRRRYRKVWFNFILKSLRKRRITDIFFLLGK